MLIMKSILVYMIVTYCIYRSVIYISVYIIDKFHTKWKICVSSQLMIFSRLVFDMGWICSWPLIIIVLTRKRCFVVVFKFHVTNNSDITKTKIGSSWLKGRFLRNFIVCMLSNQKLGNWLGNLSNIYYNNKK